MDTSTIIDGSKLTGSVSLWWTPRMFRTDETFGDSQLVTTTMVTYNDRLVYVYSPNNTLCSVFCLPPASTAQLPRLGIAPNNTQGSTYYVGSNTWLRVTDVGSRPVLGVYNASVIYQLSSSSLPLQSFANFSYQDSVVATRSCSFRSFSSQSPSPSVFSVPSQCMSLRARNCYAPLRYTPFPVGQGCFYAESVAPFGGPGYTSCTCSFDNNNKGAKIKF